MIKSEVYNQLMNHKEREMTTRISLLDWANENEIQSIEGRITDGNIVVDGNSPVRRTCSLTMVVDKNATDGQERISDLISINKKVKVEIGLKNTTTYKDLGDVIWFNMGVYILTEVVYTHDLDNATISITALDKMCLWSGDLGGELSVPLNLYELGGDDAGTVPSYYEIIMGLATTFGEQDPGRILIQDVDEKIRRVIQKTSAGTMYFSKNDFAYMEAPGGNRDDVIAIDKGDYMYVYEKYGPVESQKEEFQLNIGQTITDALDLVKNALGNYEYFFDLDGNFVFQEIQNFQNTSYSSELTSLLTTYGNDISDYDATVKSAQSITDGDYITSFSNSPYTYSFEDSEIATAFTNVPDWRGIKNNFLVYGADWKMLHIAIDEKPTPPTIWYMDESDLEEMIPAPTFYIGLQIGEELWGLYVDWNFQLQCQKLTSSDYVYQIVGDSITVKDRTATQTYTKITVKNGEIYESPVLSSEFKGTKYNGFILKSQRGCDCVVYCNDYYEPNNINIFKPYRHLYGITAPNGLKYEMYCEGRDHIAFEVAEDFFFKDIYDPLDKGIPEVKFPKQYYLRNEKNEIGVMRIDNECRINVKFEEEIPEDAEIKDQIFLLDIKGGGINILLYKDRIQFDRSFTIAVEYNQPWQQYIIDLGDQIIAQTPAGNTPLLPRWYTELKEYFPKIYQRNANFYGGDWLKAYDSSGNPIYSGMGDSAVWPYYFDMIDESTALGQYSINAIGMRTKAEVDEEDITMLYPPVRRNYCMLKPSETESTDLMDWLNAKEQPYLILKDDDAFDSNFAYACYGKDAFTKIREMIYLHTSLNETVNISSMPIFYLEPNTRIIARDEETNTSGSYVILTINFPLTFDGQQQLSCIRVDDRL